MSATRKRIIVALIMLAILMFMASLAWAGTIGHWSIKSGSSTPYIPENGYFTGTVDQQRTYKTGYVINTETTGSTPGFIYKQGTSTPATMQVMVQYKQGTNTYFDAAPWRTFYNNARVPNNSYYSGYADTLGSFRLRLYNPNNYNIETVGTWKPDT